jgi:hypothetical protein
MIDLETHAHLEVSLKPSIVFISLARRFIYDAYADILKDSDLAWRLGMATHELLENAVKYSTDGSMTLRITIVPQPSNRLLVLTVKNRTDAKNAEILKMAFEEMEQFKSPAQYYAAILERAAVRTEGSGLGLGRIRMEASMSLSCHLEDNVVCLQASIPIP